MSVLIKGMQMPKNCKECPFLYDGNACYAMNLPIRPFLPLVCNGSTDEYKLNEFPFEEKRVDWCPLVEVPTSHGRLADADYLKEHIIACATNGRPLHKMELSELLEAIGDVPTVIEAEYPELPDWCYEDCDCLDGKCPYYIEDGCRLAGDS